MEQELLKVKKLESVGVLAGGIAHDFNNILAAILGNINLALIDESLNDETKKLLTAAEKASMRAKNLTQQLLTFAKGGEPVKEITSLVEVIKESANFVLHGDTVACKFNIQDNLWDVNIDKGQISQVIQNIVINASHAMPGSGIIQIDCINIDTPVSYDSSLAKDTKYVQIKITDTGVGIPKNIIGKIFDPYFSTKQDGSGLGLAITHSIIKNHDGYIEVESEPGAGTTFRIYLPADTMQREKESIEEEKQPHKSNLTIMVMDDEEMVRNVSESMLKRLGHRAVLVEDGAQAVRLYKEHKESSKPIDLIIMDLTIPGGMGGQEAVSEILAFDSDAKVIVSSGYSTDPIMANCQEYGFAGAVVKPFNMKELTKVIDNVV
jgi:CheY-like chemotaxis protein